VADSPAFGDRVRTRCTATGRCIGWYDGEHWALYVSAMDNSLNLDRVADGEPHPDLPVPSDEALAAAAAGLSTGLRRSGVRRG
jgi:hypothetical protein